MTCDVLYDACAMFGNTARDLLIRITMARMVRAHWSDRILDELDDALAEKYGIALEKLALLRARMNRANPDGMVTNFDHRIDGLDLPDPDDRHVLAAAIESGASIIVTDNVGDFPSYVLSKYKVRTQTVDQFIFDLVEANLVGVYACVQQIADSRRRPPQTVNEVLEQLSRSGLTRSVVALRLS